MKKLPMSRLQILMANALDVAWKNICEIDMMISLFVYVVLSLNVDSSEYHRISFKDKSPSSRFSPFFFFLRRGGGGVGNELH